MLLTYSNSLENGFHFDDFHTIVDNPSIRTLNNIPAFFRDATLFSVQPANRTYRPVVSASLALDYALAHGYEPFWFHLSTFVWFLALLLLLGLLYFRTMERLRPHATQSNALCSILGMAWFGLHPAIAETMNYVIQRGDVYCTLGCVAALVGWAFWPEGRRFGLYLLPLALALLSKPPAAVFPVLLLFWVYFFESQGTSWQRWRKALTAIVPSLTVVAALMVLQARMTPKSFLPSQISPTAYRMTQPLVWLRYFSEFFLPLHLNVDTDLPAYSHINASIAAGFIFLVALGAGIWYTARRRELYPVAFGLIWFVVTQLPTSLYALSEVENDHRMFFSFAGLMLAVIWSLRLLIETWLSKPHAAWVPRALVACGLLALSGYAWGAHVRNAVWRSEDSLWKDDAEKSPHNGRGLMIYGLTLMNHGDLTGAKAEFEKALQFTPNYSTLEINLGVVNGAMGNTTEAERHFVRAIVLAPSDDQTHAFYGRWLLDQRRAPEAVVQLREAVHLNPMRSLQQGLLTRALTTLQQNNAVPQSGAATAVVDWINRSMTLNQAGKFDESIAAAREALKLDPNSAEAWNNIAAGYESEKKWDLAIAAAQKAVALRPDFQLAKNNLVWSEQQKALEAAKTR